MKFMVDLWLDGYDTQEELDNACKNFIHEQLNWTASSVNIKELYEKFYITAYKRAKLRFEILKSEHKGREMELTYHAGREIGLSEGRLYLLYDILEDLGINVEELDGEINES